MTYLPLLHFAFDILDHVQDSLTVSHRRGKTLGGGSSINGAAWTRGLDAQYDAWGSLLEASEAFLDWSWNSLFNYMKKVQYLIILSIPCHPFSHQSNYMLMNHLFRQKRSHLRTGNNVKRVRIAWIATMGLTGQFKQRSRTLCTVALNRVTLLKLSNP